MVNRRYVFLVVCNLEMIFAVVVEGNKGAKYQMSQIVSEMLRVETGQYYIITMDVSLECSIETVN